MNRSSNRIISVVHSHLCFILRIIGHHILVWIPDRVISWMQNHCSRRAIPVHNEDQIRSDLSSQTHHNHHFSSRFRWRDLHKIWRWWWWRKNIINKMVWETKRSDCHVGHRRTRIALHTRLCSHWEATTNDDLCHDFCSLWSNFYGYLRLHFAWKRLCVSVESRRKDEERIHHNVNDDVDDDDDDDDDEKWIIRGILFSCACASQSLSSFIRHRQQRRLWWWFHQSSSLPFFLCVLCCCVDSLSPQYAFASEDERTSKDICACSASAQVSFRHTCILAGVVHSLLYQQVKKSI